MGLKRYDVEGYDYEVCINKDGDFILYDDLVALIAEKGEITLEDLD